MLGRILRSADFARVLGQAPCVRGPHFAVHFAEGRPLGTSNSATLARGRKGALSPKLSTSDKPPCTQLVDDLPATTPTAALAAGPQVWFGAVLPKRHARRAVTRMLIKRQIRAAMLRRDAPGLRPGLWIVRLRAPFDPAAYPSAASESLRRAAGGELDTLLGEAQRKLDVAVPARRGASNGLEAA